MDLQTQRVSLIGLKHLINNEEATRIKPTASHTVTGEDPRPERFSDLENFEIVK
jgi:hypothetical protein